MSASPVLAAFAASPDLSAAFASLGESADRVSNSSSWGDVKVTLTSEAPSVPGTLVSEGAFTRPTPKRRGASSAATLIPGYAPEKEYREAVVSEIISRFEASFEITVADFKKLHEHLKVKFGNLLWNGTSPLLGLLFSSPAGKIVWVVNKAHEKDGVAKPSDVDVFAETYRINGKPLKRDAAFTLFALALNGHHNGLVLTDYLPKAKSVKEVIRGYLDTHESKNSGCKFEIVEGTNPYILAVKVVNPVPTITTHGDDGKVVKTPVQPITGPINTKPSAPNSYAEKAGGGAGGPKPNAGTHFPVLSSAAPVAPIHVVTAPAVATVEPAFDATRLARILAHLAPLVGKSAQELTEMKADGMLPAAALKLLA